MFEKNRSTSVKDMLIDLIADKQEYSRDTIEKVVNFQGEDFLRAVRQHNQIEISGLGLLFISKGKLQKRIDRAKNRLGEEGKGYLEENLRFLESKMKQICQN